MTVIDNACPPASTTTPAPLLPPPEPAAATAAGLDEQQRAALPLGILNPAVIPYGTSAQHAQLLAGRSRYLCYFLHRHLEFRLAEVECLAGLVQQQQRQKAQKEQQDGREDVLTKQQQAKAQQHGREEGRERQQQAEQQQQAKEQQAEQRAVVWEKPFENWVSGFVGGCCWCCLGTGWETVQLVLALDCCCLACRCLTAAAAHGCFCCPLLLLLPLLLDRCCPLLPLPLLLTSPVTQHGCTLLAAMLLHTVHVPSRPSICLPALHNSCQPCFCHPLMPPSHATLTCPSLPVPPSPVHLQCLSPSHTLSLAPSLTR